MIAFPPRIAVCIAGLLWAAAGVQAQDSHAEFTWLREQRSANPQGPLAAAQALQAGLARSTPSSSTLQAELRHTQRLGSSGLALQGNGLLRHAWPQGGPSVDTSRVNELHASADLGAWQLAAGKKVLGWDVGYAFRPNDLVQREERRTQLSQTPEGRALVQAEYFGASSAWAWVWVNPQRWNEDPQQPWRGAEESALAARAYQRLGALDLYGFARRGRHSGSSLGAALAWVPGDAWELHASARSLQRHDGWQIAPGVTGQPVATNPWQATSLGQAQQALLGLQWTGAAQQSLMAEFWHDGTALSRAQWRQWGARNAALAAWAAQSGQALAAAGNLAWQATPLQASSLQRDNLYLRASWQPTAGSAWQLTMDGLYHPADQGRMLTAAVQWQGQRWRLNASWRQWGGPADAVLAQLPSRRSLLLAASLAL